jgi:maleate cis-trans isomerase
VHYLSQCNIDVVNEYTLERELNSLEQNALTPQDAYEMALKSDHADAQAVVVSCTDFRALEAVPQIEKTLGKPVITSNQALMFACLRELQISPLSIKAGGCLFTGE